ncbi:hypothetical protein WJX74_002395 [Apatococcus lobatus]|uniref:Uncharacterized protein n=1 Tax=Apatococcus lobatus TaxID=904363 RepID=A0AAW1QIX8_9CHLO
MSTVAEIQAAWEQQEWLHRLQQQQEEEAQAGYDQAAREEAGLMAGGPLMQQGRTEKLVRLERAVSILQRELGLSRIREKKAEELVSSLQPVFLNQSAVRVEGRQAVFKLMSAYANLYEVPETDRSFPQAEFQFTAFQKAKAVAKRQAFYQELGRLLQYRERLLKPLERSAMWLDEATGGEVELLLSQPSSIASQAISLVQQLKQTIDYQQYLMRTFSYEVMLEIMTPIQHAILVGRSLPYEMDVMAAVEALARERPDFKSASQFLSVPLSQQGALGQPSSSS